MPLNKVHIGLIGVNYGALAHVPVYQALPEVELTAVCTAHAETAAAARERFNVPYVFHNYEEMVKCDAIDVVAVVTRPRLHYPMTMSALQAGKHVLCEAPLAMNVQEAREMYNLASQKGLINIVNMQSRYGLAHAKMKELINQGFLGQPLYVNASMFSSVFADPERVPLPFIWCADRANGASTLRVYGTHSTDLLRWFFGDIVAVCGRADTFVKEWRNPENNEPIPVTSHDSCGYVVRFQSGALGVVETAWGAPGGSGWRLEAYGTEGKLVVTGPGPMSPANRLFGVKKGGAEMTELTAAPSDEVQGVDGNIARLYREFIAAIGEGRRASPSFRDGVRMNEMVDAVERSGEGAGWVSLSLDL